MSEEPSSLKRSLWFYYMRPCSTYQNWWFFSFNYWALVVWMQDSGMEAFQAHQPGHEDCMLPKEEFTCPHFPHWPQRLALSENHLRSKDKHDKCRHFQILDLNGNYSDSKYAKIGELLNRLGSSHPFVILHPNVEKILSNFYANFVVFQHKVILTR